MVKLVVLMLLILKSLSSGMNRPYMIPLFTFKLYPNNKVTVFIGDQSIQFQASIDLMNQNCVFILNQFTEYHSSYSTTINPNKQLSFANKTAIGKEMEDLFGFEEENIGPQVKIRFDFIANDSTLYHFNRISLPFIFKDEAYSIIHQLKNKGFIKHLSFSRIRNKIVHYFFFGGIPEEFIINQTTVSHCNVIGNYGYWDCSLHEITIGNNNQIYKYQPSEGTVAIFDFEKVFIYAPTYFIDFLFNTFFKEYIIRGDCCINDSMRRLSCRADVLFTFIRITFAIGDYLHTFDLEQFMKCSVGRCFLEILDNPDGNYWRFGSYFYDNLEVLFDYEAKKIVFYSNKGVELYYKGSKYNIRNAFNKIICITSSSIMLCGVILMIFFKTTFKNQSIHSFNSYSF